MKTGPEGGCPLWLPGSQVMLFTRIVAQTVKLDVIVLEVFQQFPVAGAHSTDGRGGGVIVGVVEEERVALEVRMEARVGEQTGIA